MFFAVKSYCVKRKLTPSICIDTSCLFNFSEHFFNVLKSFEKMHMHLNENKAFEKKKTIALANCITLNVVLGGDKD